MKKGTDGKCLCEYRIVHKYGTDYIEVRYKGTEWSGWLFKTSKTPKKYYIYVPELKLYRCNVSSF